MLTDFLIRIRAHTLPSLEGLREGLFAVAERVNRRTQIVRLHWQSSSMVAGISALHTFVGRVFVERLSSSSPVNSHKQPFSTDREALAELLAESSTEIQRIRKDLLTIENAIGDLETENLSETLVRIHRDLAARSATIERVSLPVGSPLLAMTSREVELATGARIAALLRGPTLLQSYDQLVLRPGDVMFLVGMQKELRARLLHLMPGPSAPA